MTPQQREELIAAVDAGDDVKAVTLSLQIAAWNARQGLHEEAEQCRRLVDELSRAEADRAQYMQNRLKVAAELMPVLMPGRPHMKGWAEEWATLAVKCADALLDAVVSVEIGGGNRQGE